VRGQREGGGRVVEVAAHGTSLLVTTKTAKTDRKPVQI
jgi:hypothetical protein